MGREIANGTGSSRTTHTLTRARSTRGLMMDHLRKQSFSITYSQKPSMASPLTPGTMRPSISSTDSRRTHFHGEPPNTDAFAVPKDLFRHHRPLSFVDACIAAYMRTHGLGYLYAFDDDFDALTISTGSTPRRIRMTYRMSEKSKRNIYRWHQHMRTLMALRNPIRRNRAGAEGRSRRRPSLGRCRRRQSEESLSLTNCPVALRLPRRTPTRLRPGRDHGQPPLLTTKKSTSRYRDVPTRTIA